MSFYAIDLRCVRHKHQTIEIQVGDQLPDLNVRIRLKCSRCTRREHRTVHHIWTWQQIRDVISTASGGGLEVFPLPDRHSPSCEQSSRPKASA